MLKTAHLNEKRDIGYVTKKAPYILKTEENNGTFQISLQSHTPKKLKKKIIALKLILLAGAYTRGSYCLAAAIHYTVALRKERTAREHTD